MGIGLRRVKFNNEPALLITGITDYSALSSIKAIAPVIKIREGYIVKTDRGPIFEQLYLLVSRINRTNNEKKPIHSRIDIWQKHINETAADRKYADDIKRGIINKELFTYPRGGNFLMNHQKAGAMIADRFDQYGFFYDTGTGKTILALQIIQNKIKDAGATFLVICPKSIIQTAWLDDCRHFYPTLKLLPLGGDYSAEEYKNLYFDWARATSTKISIPARFLIDGSMKDRTYYAKEYLSDLADCFIVNPERFVRSPEEYLHIKTSSGIRTIDGIIFDESSKLKNGDAKVTKTMKKVRPTVKYMYLLSGKPAPNNQTEYISQVEIIDPLVIRPGLKNDMKYNTSFFKATELTSTINTVSVTVAKSDCFDLPETNEQIRLITLPEEAMDKYQSMKYQLRVELESLSDFDKKMKKIVYANHVLSSISKLRQIAGGFIYDQSQKKEAIQIHAEKTQEALNILEELGGEQVLIWCQYQSEIEHLEQLLRNHGYTVTTAFGKTKNLNASINSFKENKVQVMIAHPRTLQYGVTLVNCHYAIYYSTSYSYEEYYQSHDRLYRKGQHCSCTYIFLQCKETIDEIMYKAIKNKQKNTEVAEAALKHIYNDN